MKRISLFALAIGGLLVAPAFAQETENRGRRGGTIDVVPPPDWSIRKEVDRLDTSMQEYNALIKSLSSASSELSKAFQAYLKDPKNEVLASSVEKKMALYAKRVMADFDDIVADQDVLGSNFRELQRKLVDFSGHLGTQAKGFDVKLQGYRGKAREHEKKLKEMAVRLKEDPPADEDELRLLKREFARELRRYNLQGRYVRGYQTRFKSYLALQKNMKTLAGMFVGLHDKFNEMIENLENERQYLHDSLRLQADTLRIKQIVRQGFLGSEKAIGNVADKLANLYIKVDAFSQVHERINSDLNAFVQSQGALTDVTKRINAIGAGAGPIGDLSQDLDKAIDLFYNEKDGLDDDKLVIEKLRAEKAAEKVAAEEAAKKAAQARKSAPEAAPQPAPERTAPEAAPQPAPDRPAPRRSVRKKPASPAPTKPKTATSGKLVPLPEREPLPETPESE
ncbi:MAG TPA: hypothetical protein DEA08_18025 [Planctomycetes bacterium]|nr:hypothetical protein [Planctomycetota bacterium]